jgi:hypothetical protein
MLDTDTKRRVITVLERKPKHTDLRVLVVNEDMGL